MTDKAHKAFAPTEGLKVEVHALPAMLGATQAITIPACRKVCNVKLSIYLWERRDADSGCHTNSAVLSAIAAATDFTFVHTTRTQVVCQYFCAAW